MLVEATAFGCGAGVVEANAGFWRKPSLMQLVRILVVDDFQPWRAVVRRILAERSCLQIVGEACNGPEAIQKAGTLHPDLILLDIAMPGLNGISVARKIREVAAHSRIVFLTQECSREIAQEGLNAGAQGYVLKTRAESELLAAIDTVLDGKQFLGEGLEI